jgi:hypothetical protein
MNRQKNQSYNYFSRIILQSLFTSIILVKQQQLSRKEILYSMISQEEYLIIAEKRKDLQEFYERGAMRNIPLEYLAKLKHIYRIHCQADLCIHCTASLPIHLKRVMDLLVLPYEKTMNDAQTKEINGQSEKAKGPKSNSGHSVTSARGK